MHGLTGYVIRRLLIVPVILLAVSAVTFALGRFAPSDYVEIAVGTGKANPETVERIKEERGLNDPIYQQYARWLGKAVQGDLGNSTRYRGVPVEDVIFPRLWVTLQYNIVVLILTFAIGIPVGTWAALRRGTWQDPVAIASFLVFASVPVIISVPLLRWLLAVKLDLLPTGGWQSQEVLGVSIGLASKEAILPVLIMSLGGVAGLARYMRVQVLDVLDQDYVRTARSKGLRESIVVVRHTVRNALLPIVTILGFDISALFGGSIILETLLGIPGIGQFTYESINARDYDSIMAIVLLGATMFMLAMLLVDVAYGFIDPRIRLREEARA